MIKIILFLSFLPLLVFGQFNKISHDDLDTGNFQLKTVTLTEKVMSGILKAQEKEIEVSYKFHYPEKIIQLPKINENFNSESNPVSAYYSYLSFGLLKKFEDQRKDVEGVQARIEATRAEYMTTAKVKHDESVVALRKIFEDSKKRILDIYDLSDPEQKQKYETWLTKAKEELIVAIEKDKEEQKDFQMRRYMDEKNFRIKMRQISLPKYRKYKDRITSINKGLLFLGTIEVEYENKPAYIPLFASHDEKGKFLKIDFLLFQESNMRFALVAMKNEKIEYGFEWLALKLLSEKDITPKMKEVLKIKKIPDLE